MTMKNQSFRFSAGLDVPEWQKKARAELTGLLGITDLLAAPRCPLSPKTLWKRSNEYGTIEKIELTMEDGFKNRIYLCLPHQSRKPYRAFICLQGHSTGMHCSIEVDWHDEQTFVLSDGDRNFANECMRRGIPAICLEQRAMGENSSDPNRYPSCLLPAMSALLTGSTLLGKRIFDVDRVLDYMRECGDFDMSHVGIMGNSGGGTTTMFAAAVLPGLTHAMPSCSFSSFEASIGSIVHCSCNYVPGLLNFGESAEVLGLIAPRPLVIVSGIEDNIFPLEAAKEQFCRLKEIYAAAGAGENCRHVLGNGRHRFYADDAWPVMLSYWEE